MIRAIKYGAATDFELPLSLRMKIRKQSSLLSTVSPSRLTEEIFKIIHSSQAARIVEHLDSAGLYKFLQPQASSLFKAKQGFKEQYLKSLTALNQEGFKNLPGEALAGLIRDYMEEIAEWKGDSKHPATAPWERFKKAITTARKFVMPMNPPRIELDRAVKLLFAEHGVIIKRTRLSERRQKDDKHLSDLLHPVESLAEKPDCSPVKSKASPGRRRRKRKPAKDTGQAAAPITKI
jgi:poly(A) polymerase